MITLTRVSLVTIGLGVGAVLGGCAAPVDDETSAAEDSAAITTEASPEAVEGAVAEQDEATPSDDATPSDEAAATDQDQEKIFFGGLGGFGRFGGLGFGRAGFGWGGYPGLGFGFAGYPGFVGPGFGFAGPWGAGLGWGRSLGWGSSVTCINGFCY